MKTIDGNGREVVFTGVSFDRSSTALTFKDSTAEDLARTYNKMVTAKVDGKHIGWGDTPSFIHFKKNREDKMVIEEITFWHRHSSAKYCRYHCMLLIACGGIDKEEFYTDRLTEEQNLTYFTRYRGTWLPKSKTQEVQFKFLYR